MRTSVISAAVLVATLVGCGVSVTPRVDLPSWCPSGDCLGVPADPPRSGILGSTGDCTWIDIDGQRASALWPPHYSATFVPALIVYDESGHDVARGGQQLTTQMLGPTRQTEDECGLGQIIDVYFDPFAPSEDPS